MFLRKSLLGIAGFILVCAVAAFAQEAQTQNPSTPDSAVRKDRVEPMQRHRERLRQRDGLKGRDGVGRRGGRMGHMLRELNLSEAQRQQSRAIMQRRLQNTKAQREELFKLRERRIDGTFTADDEARAKALHQEIRTSMQGVREEMAGVLNAEQKVRLEQMKQERKERREQRVKERQERLNKNPQ